MSEKVVWQLLQPYAKAAGVPGIAPHDLRRYAESRTMPNQNAATWSQACEMGSERYRLLRMMRHSPVVTRRGEKLNSGPQVGTFCLRHHAHCFKNWLPAGLRQ